MSGLRNRSPASSPSSISAVRADEQPVAGERGQRLIGRVRISGGPQRQRLPPALACVAKAIDPRERSRPHIANSVSRRQRGDMQQQAGARYSGANSTAIMHLAPFRELNALFTICLRPRPGLCSDALRSGSSPRRSCRRFRCRRAGPQTSRARPSLSAHRSARCFQARESAWQ